MVHQEEVDVVGGPAHDEDGDHHCEHDHDLRVNMFNHIARSSQHKELQFVLRSLKWQEYFAQSQVTPCIFPQCRRHLVCNIVTHPLLVLPALV